MKGEILDKINEDSSSCFLTKLQLSDFIMSLHESYQEYEVQREIVSNTYLDNLIDTVLNRKHIPIIVLVVDEGFYKITNKNIEIKQFKILDGLQRTFRLKLIWDTIQFFKEKIKASEEILSLKRIQISRMYAQELLKINSNSKILETIINFYNSNSLAVLDECFSNYQWFEIWSNLSPKDEVNKMLILNAGHKPVKTQHQLEILFLHLIPIIKKTTKLDSFELKREKDSNSTIFSKNRVKGQFHFSHLITSILSLNEGKPITANVNLIHKTQADDFNLEDFSKYFNYEFLYRLIHLLLKFDDNLDQVYSDLGTKWLGREVSLVGIFAALGKFGIEHNMNPNELLELLEKKIIENPKTLDLVNFEKVRNTLDLSKVNIGTANKNAIYNGIFEMISNSNQSINWLTYFKGATI